MSQWLKQGTVRVITFGPFLSKGDGVTLQTGAGIITSIDHATTGILLSKNGGAATIREQGANFVASTYDAHGFFKVSLSAVDTNTLGTLMVMHSEPTTYLSVWRVFLVVPAQVWDSLFGADKLDVSVVEQANIDFGALQKLSLNAATPASIQSFGTLVSDMAAAVWGAAIRLLTAGTNIVLAKGTGLTGLNDLSAADVNAQCDTAISDAAIPAATAALVLVTPSQKIVTDANGKVTYANTAPPDTAAIKTALEADGSKLDHLWEMTEDDGGVRRLTANALEEAPTGGAAPTVVEIRQEMDTNSTRLAAILTAIGGVGTGPVAHEYTLTVDGSPCADALVIMSTDSLLANPIHQGTTNALGKVTFYPNLPAGTTVYLWRFKTGDDFINPDTEVTHA
jgi:hypothetical protein